MAFPTTPAPGDRHTENGIIYEFRTPPPRWDLIGPETGGRFEQTYTGSVWTIAHNLGQKYVSVQCVDSTGNLIIGDPDYDTINVTIMTFSQSVTGTAVVRR